MKLLELTNTKKVALVDDEDYRRCCKFSWYLDTEINGYFMVKRTSKPYTNLANYIMQTVQVRYDHKDLDTLNNQKSNLRICTISQNGANKTKVDRFKGTTSIYKGVCWNKSSKFWRAEIRVNTKLKFLGYFADETNAAKEYDKAAIKYFGEFAQLNFPTVPPEPSSHP